MAGAAGATFASGMIGTAAAAPRTGYTLFSPGAIAGMELKNRLVRSATWESAADNGRTTETLLTINHAKAVDFFGISRPLVREPDLPGRWLSGEG
jgi:2,4-dienoyl-CoA reductase-like NADH-dependent reductase (Old Yellow Enzyme family)